MESVLEGIVDRQPIGEEDAFLWLLAGDVRAESDSEIIAAQDQALQTKYRATKISQTDQTVPYYIRMLSTGTITSHKET